MRGMTRRTGLEGQLFLALMTAILVFMTIWILSNGFMLDSATIRWTRVVSALDAEEILVENLSFLMPHLPLYLLIPFYYIPGLATGAAPYLLSVIVAVFLLHLWAKNLKEVELSEHRLVILGLLVVLHPAFLWSATTGSHIALSMLAFYLLYRAAQHIISEHDLHSYISLAVVFVFYFFIDGSAIFIFVALIPLLVVIAPIRTIMVSPMSLYLIVGTPFAFALFSWAYLNWIFEGSFINFITDADSDFLGGMLHVFDYPWLLDYGGEFFMPLLAATGYLLIAFPVSVYLLLDTINNSYRFRASFVLLLHPLIAIAIATSQYYLTHPFEILTLVSAGLMAELTYVKMQTKREFVFLVIFMMVSVVGGWWLFIETASPQMAQWVQALKGEQLHSAQSDGDLQLGLWLKEHRQQTMMYERSAFRVIAARGDAKGLVLSFSHDFKAAMRSRIPDVEQIAVPEPDTLIGRRDWLNIRHPNLYAYGMKGFDLVYDYMGWRVYRKHG
ncbi:hypothetical protein [Mariprofundus sp. KV]|uniref:hypothetical protein n=1 Tax=Mariprofundus sp. KV TaxID=2608715 RepID=UPI0015A4B7A2|nr:hypothetical protein [Mariprofundus sp. KV]NWF36808.1 hypothetical protein [Mariprofundus sp. KV]